MSSRRCCRTSWPVALPAEGVDRNYNSSYEFILYGCVALPAEGVDRNFCEGLDVPYRF